MQRSIRSHIEQQVIGLIHAKGGRPYDVVREYLNAHPIEAKELDDAAGYAAKMGLVAAISSKLRKSAIEAEPGEAEVPPENLQQYLPGFEIPPSAQLVLVDAREDEWRPVSDASENQQASHFDYLAEQNRRRLRYNTKRHAEHVEFGMRLEAILPGSSDWPRKELIDYLRTHPVFDVAEHDETAFEQTPVSSR